MICFKVQIGLRWPTTTRILYLNTNLTRSVKDDRPCARENKRLVFKPRIRVVGHRKPI